MAPLTIKIMPQLKPSLSSRSLALAKQRKTNIGESWYWKVFSDTFALKDYVGVVSAEVLSDYVKTDWREYRKALLRYWLMVLLS